jgi:hypothetical protein
MGSLALAREHIVIELRLNMRRENARGIVEWPEAKPTRSYSIVARLSCRGESIVTE